VTPEWSQDGVVNRPIVGDDREGQGKREQCGLIIGDYVGEGCVFGTINLGEGEDKQGDGDRDDSVTEGNNPVDACLAFVCHFVGLSCDQLLRLSFTPESVRGRA
jgi:hypothetical protein